MRVRLPSVQSSIVLAVLTVLALLALALPAAPAPKEPDVENPKNHWRPLPEPQPGEWRWSFPEKGQTLKEYKASGPCRPTGTRRRIYLLPFTTRPPRDPGLLDNVRTVLAAFYAAEVERLPTRALPRGAYVRERRQVSAMRLAPHLVKALPNDALFLLAVTDRDLFVGDLRHAYGWGSFTRRVGVMSTHRLGEGGADAPRRRRRAVTLATHEAGHMLGIAHCTFYRCLMNGARTLDEADGRPALLCPVCRAKLLWNLGRDPLPRYAALTRAFQQVGLFPEAQEATAAANVTSHLKGS